MQIDCLECQTPLNEGELSDVGVTECIVCNSKFAVVDSTALTFIDNIPNSEYLGG